MHSLSLFASGKAALNSWNGTTSPAVSTPRVQGGCRVFRVFNAHSRVSACVPSRAALHVPSHQAGAMLSPLRFAAASLPHSGGQKRGRGRGRALPPRVQEVAEAYERAPPELSGLAMSYLPNADLATDLPPCVAGLTPAECGDADSHYARVICALCYLAMGGLDEAHNMVTPLSWESRTPFSGPPIINSPAVQEASYVHTLVHRREGQHIGEFGTGFNNAGYWARRTGAHPIMEPLRKEALELARGEPKLEEHMKGHEGGWSSNHFVRLCEETERTKDAAATEFCQRVALAEWKLLVGHCYDRM